MSGGVVGSVGIVSAIGTAAMGAALAAGAVAGVAVDIARMGSIAAYEQLKLAAACTEAVNNAKIRRTLAVESYRNKSRAELQRLNNSVESEIKRLQAKLEEKGQSVDLRALGADRNAVLLRLIAMDQSVQGVRRSARLRIPSEVYRSITEQIDPLFAYIPESDPVFTRLTNFKNKATQIAGARSMTASEKSAELVKIEGELIAKKEEFRACSRKHEYNLSQFTSLAFANKKLAEACGAQGTVLSYDPCRAEEQITHLSKANAALRKTLREKLKEDKSFIAANQELARRVMACVRTAGFRQLNASKQPYGNCALFDYRSSLLNVTVSKEGVLSMDLVAKNGETAETLKADEEKFCNSDLQRISRTLEENGLSMNVDRICNLTADSILYEDEMQAYGAQGNNSWYEDEPQVMYANPNGEG